MALIYFVDFTTRILIAKQSAEHTNDRHAILIKGSSFDGTLCTKEAYESISLQMSTGDWHVHTTELVNVKETDKVLTLDDVMYSNENFL